MSRERDKEERRYFIETLLKGGEKERWREREWGFMRISLSICLRIAEMSVDVFFSPGFSNLRVPKCSYNTR
jgi:hypothetical protein